MYMIRHYLVFCSSLPCILCVVLCVVLCVFNLHFLDALFANCLLYYAFASFFLLFLSFFFLLLTTLHDVIVIPFASCSLYSHFTII
ncbi:hypothetical protein BZA05DRAFT_403634 [Tricharina praecox]|uniref:uncharacterized protein n=1 Tax=Tricharina praecox TaxID=43433 RepID=UPI00221F0291|nr:uncharacterized protein BZA05DRAFT_403634 [Tricharina praecox]KAI5848310.1 hypothetical protein BZA05DRAFT_403634 [Tricharina praecox]